MKKKILSLLLVVSLMMAFTVTSFAKVTKTDEFSLDTYKLSDTDFQSSEIAYNDDRITINVVIDQAFPRYEIIIYDLTAGKTVYRESFKWDLKDHEVKCIDPSHSYRVWIKNNSSFKITGTMTMKIW